MNFGFDKVDRAVTVYYFYILDADFGPGFIKLCRYFPYPGKVWLNGHEWLKRQADRAGISWAPLANGFSSADRPVRLQAIADRLGPRQVQRFFDRWMRAIPTPLTDKDRRAGTGGSCPCGQVEVSRTLVLDDPRRARAFFESLVADNVGIGHPEHVAVVFARQVRKTTEEPFRTQVSVREPRRRWTSPTSTPGSGPLTQVIPRCGNHRMAAPAPVGRVPAS